MQFPGRAAAAIDCLTEIMAAGKPAEQVLTSWARAHRFAGSKDRRAIRDMVFRCLRQWRSFQALGFEGPRGALAGMLLMDRLPLDDAFGAEPHGPDALTSEERAMIGTEAGEVVDLQDWQIPLYATALGSDAAAVFAALRERAPVYLRVNARRSSVEAAVRALAEVGIEALPVADVDGALRLVGDAKNITQLPPFAEGLIEVQDLSSQRAIQSMPHLSKARILDLCAGGGGKALAAADRFPDARMFAYDIDPRRMKDLPIRAERAGVDITCLKDVPKDARYDLVMVDAPCSGSGTWRRQPDAKWKLTEDRLTSLTEIQSDLMDRATALVAPKGFLAYMTCSLFGAENTAQVDAFLTRHQDWDLIASHLNVDLGQGDGFFFTLLRKRF